MDDFFGTLQIIIYYGSMVGFLIYALVSFFIEKYNEKHDAYLEEQRLIEEEKKQREKIEADLQKTRLESEQRLEKERREEEKKRREEEKKRREEEKKRREEEKELEKKEEEKRKRIEKECQIKKDKAQIKEELIGQEVFAWKIGDGVIKEISKSIIVVLFDDGNEESFVFPQIFKDGTYLQLYNFDLQDRLEELFELKEKKQTINKNESEVKLVRTTEKDKLCLDYYQNLEIGDITNYGEVLDITYVNAKSYEAKANRAIAVKKMQPEINYSKDYVIIRSLSDADSYIDSRIAEEAEKRRIAEEERKRCLEEEKKRTRKKRKYIRAAYHNKFLGNYYYGFEEKKDYAVISGLGGDAFTVIKVDEVLTTVAEDINENMPKRVLGIFNCNDTSVEINTGSKVIVRRILDMKILTQEEYDLRIAIKNNEEKINLEKKNEIERQRIKYEHNVKKTRIQWEEIERRCEERFCLDPEDKRVLFRTIREVVPLGKPVCYAELDSKVEEIINIVERERIRRHEFETYERKLFSKMKNCYTTNGEKWCHWYNNHEHPFFESKTTIDLHDLNYNQAKQYMNIALDYLPDYCDSLTIIHGYHGGTIMKDLVQTEYFNHPRIKYIDANEDNLGITYFFFDN